MSDRPKSPPPAPSEPAPDVVTDAKGNTRVSLGSAEVKITGEDITSKTSVPLDSGGITVTGNCSEAEARAKVDEGTFVSSLGATVHIHGTHLVLGADKEHALRKVPAPKSTRTVRGRPKLPPPDLMPEQVSEFFKCGHTITETAVHFDIEEATVIKYLDEIRKTDEPEVD